jgi:hypothetical protein
MELHGMGWDGMEWDGFEWNGGGGVSWCGAVSIGRERTEEGGNMWRWVCEGVRMEWEGRESVSV